VIPAGLFLGIANQCFAYISLFYRLLYTLICVVSTAALTAALFLFIFCCKNMKPVKFKLRKPHSDRPTSINLKYYYNGKRFEMSTGRKITPKHWDEKKQRPKKSYPAYTSLNAYLDSLNRAINERHNWILSQGGYPTDSDFREAVINASGQIKVNVPTLIELIDSIIEKQTKKRTLYHRLGAKLKKFCKVKRMTTQLDSINETWFRAFETYLKDNHRENYAYRLSKQFKTVIRHSGHNWPTKDDVLNMKLTTSPTPSESISLSFDDLQQLRKAKFDDHQYNDAAKMLYAACLTGLRISDWLKFNMSANIIHVKGWKFIKIMQQKTSNSPGLKVAYPPLLPVTEEIMQGFDGYLIPSYWRNLSTDNLTTMLNTIFKELAKKAGFTKTVKLLESNKGAKEAIQYKQWEQFRTSMARKTFNTNFRDIGLNKELVNIMTGHSTNNKNMADIYDTRKFQDMAIHIIPWLEKFEEARLGGSKYNEEDIFIFDPDRLT
jgi:hypothetical protein